MWPHSLCHTCIHVKIVRSGHGSTFYLCQKSKTDTAFEKYPHQPVRACLGYEQATQPE